MKTVTLTCNRCQAEFPFTRVSPGPAPRYCCLKCLYAAKLQRKADAWRTRYRGLREAGVSSVDARSACLGQKRFEAALAAAKESNGSAAE